MQGGDLLSVLPAGLPEIEGTFANNGFHRDGHLQTGAFYTVKDDGIVSNYDDSNHGGIYGFAASRSNAIYGSASTVQPPAIRLILQAKF